MKLNRKNDLEYKHARTNLIEILTDEKKRRTAGDTIIRILGKYETFTDARDAYNDIMLFKKYFKLEGSIEYSMLQLGLEYAFDTSTVNRRIDNVLDFMIRYDIILQENKKLLFDIFGEPFEELPAKYRFIKKKK